MEGQNKEKFSLHDEMEMNLKHADETKKKMSDEDQQKLNNSIIYQVFHSIYQSATDTLDQPAMKSNIESLEEEIGENATKLIVSMIISNCAGVAFDAVMKFSDMIIFPALDKIESDVSTSIAGTSMELSAIKDSVSVLRKRIETIKTEIVQSEVLGKQ